MNKKITEVSFHCRCKSIMERNRLKEELKIRAAINRMTSAQYLIELFAKTKREL